MKTIQILIKRDLDMLFLNCVTIKMLPGDYFRNTKPTEAVARRCSVKKVLLEISQNSQETPVPEILF